MIERNFQSSKTSNNISNRSFESGTGQSSGTGKMHRFVRRKVCRFCMDKLDLIDYKDVVRLKRYINDRGKIIPRRISGNCARHQRLLTRAIKRARMFSLLPFTND